jgi:hypothetical protein
MRTPVCFAQGPWGSATPAWTFFIASWTLYIFVHIINNFHGISCYIVQEVKLEITHFLIDVQSRCQSCCNCFNFLFGQKILIPTSTCSLQRVPTFFVRLFVTWKNIAFTNIPFTNFSSLLQSFSKKSLARWWVSRDWWLVDVRKQARWASP